MTTRFFRIAAFVELVTLVVLLANLATVHLRPVTSLIGPTHGCAYLVIVLATWRNRQAATAAKAVALLPGIGGLLVLRQLPQALPQTSAPASPEALPQTSAPNSNAEMSQR